MVRDLTEPPPTPRSLLLFRRDQSSLQSKHRPATACIGLRAEPVSGDFTDRRRNTCREEFARPRVFGSSE
ncbi:hypothetical protein DM860_013739 [Cuscuta australis]|uniref:Uncharacterized protein n=1 Tax=Cuscuta australis TaxID=267555 RepID=A0A328DMT9_9ASTE|nr:hypothetical protein DM860_013739 [Cuscuta australis]